jgi:DNA-binding MarR family transcriptional regulator
VHLQSASGSDAGIITGRNSGKKSNWVSLSELARLKGVSVPAISKRVNRLSVNGLLEVRPTDDGKKLVEVGAFERAVALSRDARREQKVDAPEIVPRNGEVPVLAHAQARKMAFSAERERLKLGVETKSLLRADDVGRAMAECAGKIVNLLEVLPYRADELAAAASKDGVKGVRGVLKRMARDLRRQMAAEMSRTAAQNGLDEPGDGDDEP